ncbi:DUF7550 family protein [Halocatena marina]|uniref:Uncharacterized protein n=1 Tax=Halocatena marina TaxID=2934937 RepID=A0ABD5YJA9_9EURY|nr:hypothetical protein [Halocatena marina]
MVKPESVKETIQIERQTAPQEEYTMRDVGIGFVVAIIGMVIAFGIPILTTV